MPTRRRGWSTPAAVPTAAAPSSAPAVDGAWCWCGNLVVARCVDCGRLPVRAPPPAGRPAASRPRPRLAAAGPGDGLARRGRTTSRRPGEMPSSILAGSVLTLAEQLFLGAYGERPDLALCRDCRSQAGLELIVAWRLTTPPIDGWERARWLMDHGFEPARVAATVDVGPRRSALVHFVNVAGRATTSTDVGPDRLTILWRRGQQGPRHQAVDRLRMDPAGRRPTRRSGARRAPPGPTSSCRPTPWPTSTAGLRSLHRARRHGQAGPELRVPPAHGRSLAARDARRPRLPHGRRAGRRSPEPVAVAAAVAPEPATEHEDGARATADAQTAAG